MSMEIGKQYEVEVVDAGITETKEKNPQVFIQFTDGQGDFITAFLSLSEAAFEHTAKKLKAVGFDLDQNDGAIHLLNDEPTPIKGVRCRITVEAHTYDGKTQRQVGWINPLHGNIRRASPEAAQAATERARLAVAAARARQGRVVVQGTKPAADDNTPF